MNRGPQSCAGHQDAGQINGPACPPWSLQSDRGGGRGGTHAERTVTSPSDRHYDEGGHTERPSNPGQGPSTQKAQWTRKVLRGGAA